MDDWSALLLALAALVVPLALAWAVVAVTPSRGSPQRRLLRWRKTHDDSA